MAKMATEWMKATHDNLIQLLDSLYIDSRYPGDMGLFTAPTLEDAKEFYEFSVIVFHKVCNILDVDIQKIEKLNAGG